MDGASLDVIRGLTSIYRDASLSSALPSATVSIDDRPEPTRQVFTATADFFSMLGVAAQPARLHAVEPVAIISDRFWSARFRRDPHVLGRPIVVNGVAFPIAGVAAPGFLGISLDSAGDIWLLQPQFRGRRDLRPSRGSRRASRSNKPRPRPQGRSATPISPRPGADGARYRPRCFLAARARRAFANGTAYRCSR